MSTWPTRKPFKQHVDENWSARTAFIHGAEVGTLFSKLLRARPEDRIEDYVHEDNIENMMRLGEAFGRSVIGGPAPDGMGAGKITVSFGMAVWRILEQRDAQREQEAGS
jgi:hypothetical protein